ncbi:hypothetical protein IQ13_4259 [Lacibacter cauensis]|uniref:Uncharacterized protein n=1 Tax=Lacibacter cauensis TaxID=510947 RepID=A0A562S9G3_9BACT|nr:hypothetical protein [Lacibacter cauensis]TWI78015.1 hypothetical protein IQ13_4259 [Lacibacter cauensis]
MKTITLKSIVLVSAFSFIQNKIDAQVINWKNISKQNKQLLHVNVGAEYGAIAGVGYHHLVPIKRFPLWIGGEFSMPAGKELADDFKVRLGAQIKLVAFNHFQFSGRLQGVARRYHNQSITLFNFGSDFAGVLGYYRKQWFCGVEAGFDKAIVTNFKHSEWYRRNIYDNVQDGWYEPATGGNFYYGLQGGYSMKKIDISLKAGRILQQDFISQPLLPFYGQLGVNFRF